jgi:hypothetical protein
MVFHDLVRRRNVHPWIATKVKVKKKTANLNLNLNLVLVLVLVLVSTLFLHVSHHSSLLHPWHRALPNLHFHSLIFSLLWISQTFQSQQVNLGSEALWAGR